MGPYFTLLSQHPIAQTGVPVPKLVERFPDTGGLTLELNFRAPAGKLGQVSGDLKGKIHAVRHFRLRLAAIPFSRVPATVSFQSILQAKSLLHPMTRPSQKEAEGDAELKQRVREFWQAHPCGTKFSDAAIGSQEFFERVEEHRYTKEAHILAAADFAGTRGLKVLEIGCGLGTDGAQFAKAGADYTGIDLTEASIELARQRFGLFGLPGEFRVGDAEKLDFADESFDLVFSHGVLHHTPDIKSALREIHRVLKPGGQARVMLYHRDSYNYRIGIRVLRRAGAKLLKHESGLKLVHRLTGEPVASLREHARLANGGLSAEEFLSQSTDGAGNPLARVYSRTEARELFQHFREVELRVYFLNKRFIPLIGNLLPMSIETALAARWGWHLWIYATK